MIRRPPRSTLSSSSAASDVYKRQPFAFLLISTTMFVGYAMNALVFVVGVTQEISRDYPLGASPQVPSIILSLMCIIPALMVVRGFVPYFKKEGDADRNQSETEPLI
eukprot:TRINITY_DN8055_c0_g1_i2.p1 TRINITY_DN8055_c0_g1~~TRINITY_DN8055_c0_g1_i2.p1  ORF type:complete len:107 (+),score=34.35 TRINITY_DN8055_c0_g1_i2:68-388(+)